MKILSVLAKISWKINLIPSAPFFSIRGRQKRGCSGDEISEKYKLDFSRSALFHMKTRVCLKYFVNDCRLIMVIVCSYHVTYAFQSESTLYSCLNVKEVLAQSRREIWSLSDCNWAWTHNRLVHKRTLNHLAKTKWLWARLQFQSLNDGDVHFFPFLVENTLLGKIWYQNSKSII